MFALVVLMEYKLQVLGHKAEEERIWALILEARALVNNARQKKQVYSTNPLISPHEIKTTPLLRKAFGSPK